MCWREYLDRTERK